MGIRTLALIVGLALFGGAALMPVASAFSVGIDADGVQELENAGGNAKYGQVWAGRWLKSSGWGGFESDLRDARDGGATPVILWYYWGDQISVNTVKYGKDGMSRGDWDSMAKTLASKTKSIMGSREFIVVLEPEFNKNGISSWDTFDGYLQNQANLIKGIAPNAKIVIGFGHWGGWDNFDRAMSEATYSGTQLMRASTRDSADEGESMAQQALDVTKKLKGRFGKPVLLYDLAVSSYGGWSGVQEQAIKGFQSKRGELDSAGLVGVVYRYARDNCKSSGYFGEAECYWGLKSSGGTAKPAWNNFVDLSKGSSSSSTSGDSGGSSSGSFDASFSGIKVQEWWVQTSVSGSKSVSKVHARVGSDGSWVELPKQSWGGYAKSIHVKWGQCVEFRATASDGSTDTGGRTCYGSSSGSTDSSSSSSSGSFDATFSGIKVQEWWVQTSVSGSKSVSKVHARVGSDGSWVELPKQSWGGYAKSIHVKWGQCVEFRATASDGSTDTGGRTCYGSSSSGDSSSSGSFDATFSGVKVDEWWVQASVSGSKSISKVHARVNGGSWIELPKKDWGAYAKSIHVESGKYVEFRATASDGSTDVSGKYW